MGGGQKNAECRALLVTRKGLKNVVNITRAMKESGVKYLTLYAFSTENWQRSQDEVTALMQLLRDYLDKEFKEIMENNVRIVFIGERDMLAEDIQQKIKTVEAESAGNTDLTLCIALSYGSRQEILCAAKKAMTLALEKKNISERFICRNVFFSALHKRYS